MKRLDFPGGWYSDATPDGGYVISPFHGDSVLQTAHGPVTFEEHTRLIFTVLADDGVQIAAIGLGGSLNDRAWRWDGQRWHDHGFAFGPFGVMFDKANRLHVVQPPVAHGYRYAGPDGLVTANDTYADPLRQVWEYTTQGDVTVGQGGNGPYGDDPLIVLYRDARYLIERGRCRAVRFRRSDNNLAIAWVREDNVTASVLWLTVAELSTFPRLGLEPPPIEPPKEPPVSQLDTIRAIRSQYPTPLGATHAQFLLDCAAQTKMGLLRKTGGTRIALPQPHWEGGAPIEVSQDILMDPASGRIYDFLGDGEGAATPGWSEAEGSPQPLSRIYVPVGGGDDDDPGDTDNPPPPPPDTTWQREIERRLTALENAKLSIEIVRR